VLVDRVEAHHTLLFNEPGCTGVLALRGSPADHFALMARERDFPYMVLDNHALAETGLRCPGRIIPFGTSLTVDFSTGNVYLGDGMVAWAVEDPAMVAAQQLLAGQESPVPLRLNLDTMDDIPDGLPVDATGVGLLRTEHMVRRSGMYRVLRMFLESDEAHVRQEALEHWTGFFQREFTRCFVLVRGCPVTIRLLDYPLHELGGRLATEVNPMLGMRGVRQGLQWPALYRAQIEALLQAATWVQQQGLPLHTVEIMVPLVSFVEEVYTVRRWVEQALAALPGGQFLPVKVGAMIETPAAALSAALLANACDFLSFGTNDLTQFSLGLSREDYPPILWNYRQHHLLQHDPFQSLHPTMIKMVRDAVGHAKQTRPAIMLGLCGAHAADPQVLELCKLGLLDYLSVPRYHFPLVKLQAIQALGT
jgi:pyruvate,orthophosphate dikinase